MRKFVPYLNLNFVNVTTQTNKQSQLLLVTFNNSDSLSAAQIQLTISAPYMIVVMDPL